MTSAVVSVSAAVRRFIGLGAVESPFVGPGSSDRRGRCRRSRSRPPRLALRVAAFEIVVTVGRPYASCCWVLSWRWASFADVFGWSRAVAPLIVAAQMLECVRLLRMSSMGPAGPESPGSGTIGVWRPRCPLPWPPAGWMALAIPIDPDWIEALG
jgi:hypothetical protein